MKTFRPALLLTAVCLLTISQHSRAGAPVLKVNTPALNSDKDLIIIGSAEDSFEAGSSSTAPVLAAAGVAEVRYQIEGSSKWKKAQLLAKGKFFTGWTLNFKNDKATGKRVLFYAVDIAGLKSAITSIRFKRSTGSPAATTTPGTGTGGGTGTGTGTTPATGTIIGDLPTGAPTPPRATGGNTAITLPTITIETIVATAKEGAAATIGTPPKAAILAETGSCRITRNGAPLSASLNVQVTVNSSSTASTSDYTIVPAVTSALVIPAGSSFLDVTLTPVTDTLEDANSSETLVLSVGASVDYNLGTTTSATVTIQNTPVQAP